MIPVVTVSQMRSIDEAAIGGDETKGYGYMLKAGTGLFKSAQKFVPDKSGGHIAVICGRGNNGGKAYDEGDAASVDDAAQYIASQMVGSQPQGLARARIHKSRRLEP